MNNLSNEVQGVGIEAIGISLPSLGLDLDELALLRGVESNKYKLGLGCQKMSLCESNQEVIDLAVRAAKRCLANWEGDKANIDLIAVGTETPLDKSRPFSAWVAEALDLTAHVRSYEVKHACYGGTLAIMQAAERYLARQENDKYALVIAIDAALYEPASAGESTQGAAAIAFIIGKPIIAKINITSVSYSKPVFDFWKPMDEDYPRVDGKYSLDCYIEACKQCFTKFFATKKVNLADYEALCFHTPFPAMVKKAFLSLGEIFNSNESEMVKLYEIKVDKYLDWNRITGNSYTASLWLAVSNALTKIKPKDKFLAFSYGSGCGAELIEFEVVDNTQQHWVENFSADIKNTRYLNKEEYQQLRKDQG